jgi:hypothetical protein
MATKIFIHFVFIPFQTSYFCMSVTSVQSKERGADQKTAFAVVGFLM